ncbi:MAG: NTP transferase domain-containing protein [Trueperaceae bacterium]|nr:NTP transferase domain-containing protein [Trueperaceae bacterium]
MDALCLAAGQGTRFGSLGRYLQKCMYPVGLTPFVAYSVHNLLRSGAVRPGRDRLTLVIGHHGDQVRRYFGDAYHGLAVAYLDQARPEGTGHALALAQEALRPASSLLCWLADAYVPATSFAQLAAHRADTVLTLAPDPAGENPRVRTDVRDGRVVRALQGRGPGADMGVWKMAPDVMRDMRDRGADGEIRMLPNLQRMIDAGREVGYVEAREWLHLGGTAPTPEANVLRVVDRVRALEGLEGPA